MVWDRLFGTFAAERDEEPPKYGLIHNIRHLQPDQDRVPRVGRHVARREARAQRARGVHVRFGPPGWRPDGAGPTAANLRAAWLRETAGSAA